MATFWDSLASSDLYKPDMWRGPFLTLDDIFPQSIGEGDGPGPRYLSNTGKLVLAGGVAVAALLLFMPSGGRR